MLTLRQFVTPVILTEFFDVFFRFVAKAEKKEKYSRKKQATGKDGCLTHKHCSLEKEWGYDPALQ